VDVSTVDYLTTLPTTIATRFVSYFSFVLKVAHIKQEAEAEEEESAVPTR